MAGQWVLRFAFCPPRKTNATTGLTKANTFDRFDGKSGGWRDVGARQEPTLRNDNQYLYNPNSRRSSKVKVTIVLELDGVE
ncbi:hypothetical protein BGW80DRAFT_1372260 [Lactifluus volemus]|nr:hypothetical protein BGW80DRAFT_1372260 [Lactifluus volemus]